MSAPPKTIRCAIYTRKSSEEGLEQDFNSLHAQREACEAYVKSQVGEGWVALPEAYDDGGYSGGSMDRPGLEQLLRDVAAKRIDVVVVYKVDRLTRSLGDFARIVETFDAAGASFVSVTQAFNTTTSMGRLTLNVLLSFAQFEREVTGERIRDKIAASKAKGLWMGGGLPIGYDAAGRTLSINAAEAEAVRHIYSRYLELGSVHQLKVELEAQGFKSKRTVAQNGNVRGGVAMNRGALFHMLSNRLYRGEIPHKGTWHPGQHPPIIDAETFDAVQIKLTENAGPKRRRALGLEPLAPSAPLVGLVRHAEAGKLSPVAQRRRGGVYRYYVSTATLRGDRTVRSYRTSAAPLETLVRERLQAHGIIPADVGADDWAAVRATLISVEINQHDVRIAITPDAWRQRQTTPPVEDDRLIETPDQTALVTQARLARRGGAAKLVRPEGSESVGGMMDPTLLRALVRAESWRRSLIQGEIDSVAQIARNERIQIGYASRVLRLAFLAPDLKRAILDGRAPPHLFLQRLMVEGVPDRWSDQRKPARLGERLARAEANYFG